MQAPNGLTYIDNFITDDYQNELVNFFDKQQWISLNSRRSQQYGYQLDFSIRGNKHAEKQICMTQYVEIPSILNPFLNKLYDHQIYHKENESISQIIVNEYRQNDGIARHIDRSIFGPTVVSLSLIDKTIMIMHNLENKSKYDIVLNPLSLLILKNESRYSWQHEIPRLNYYKMENNNILKRDGNFRRISITCRSFLDTKN